MIFSRGIATIKLGSECKQEGLVDGGIPNYCL